MRALQKAMIRVKKQLDKGEIPKKNVSLVSTAATYVLYWQLKNENEELRKALYSAVCYIGQRS